VPYTNHSSQNSPQFDALTTQKNIFSKKKKKKRKQEDKNQGKASLLIEEPS